MATTRILITDLQIGMYVSSLDLPWYRSPFLRHAFLVERHAQIHKLVRAGVRTVVIDPARGLVLHSQHSGATVSSATAQASPDPAVKPLKPLAQLNEEYAQAKLAKQQLTQAVQSMFTAISKTGTVNTQQAAEAIQEITIVTRTLTHSSLFMALSQNQPGESMLSQHALTTCTLSLVLGQALQFNPLELQELATAALLHDIGLLQIRPAIRHRAHTVSGLRQTEKSEFETHPNRGCVHCKGKVGSTLPSFISLPIITCTSTTVGTLKRPVGSLPPIALASSWSLTDTMNYSPDLGDHSTDITSNLSRSLSRSTERQARRTNRVDFYHPHRNLSNS